MNRESQRRSIHRRADLVPSAMGERKKSKHCSSGAEESCPGASQTILKEWDALYTSQKTQKSKKYHDGIMRLTSSSSYINQVILLDEDGAVLSSKYLKSVECIRTGHNFEFSNYLVEIGEPRTLPEDDICKGASEQVAGSKSARIGEFMGKQRDCSKNSLPCDNKKEHSEQDAVGSSSDDARFTDINNKQTLRKKSEHCISGAQQSRLDASQMILKVRKKNKRSSSGEQQIRAVGSQIILKEWDALYTTQLTQKSKKYHDGILRLSSSGSPMNQVFLLNEDGAVLSSKYLKSVECIKTGHNCEFSNYLVEIGEPRTLPVDDICKGPLEQVDGSEGARIGNFMNIKKEHSEQDADCSRSDDARSRDLNDKQIHDEWTALYTTQISQKAKKYHDGILRLVNCGLHTKQVTLLNEDGAVLSSKYLKLVECVESGRTCEFPNYLVQICERRNPTRDDTTKPLLEQVAGSRSIGSGKLTSRRKNCVDKTLPKDIHVSYSEQVGNRSISDGLFTTLKRPIRDASQILSTLRRPSPQGLACDKPSRDALISNSSDSIPLNIENNSNVAEPNVPVTTNSGQVMDDNPKGGSPRLDFEGAYQITTSKASCLKSKDACETSTCGNAVVAGNGHQCTSPSSNHSISSTQRPWGPHDRMIEITAEGKSFHYSTDGEQQRPDSSSPPMKGNISPDESPSLSDQIMTLQQEWTTLAHRVSAMGNARSSIRFRQDNTQADEALLSATPPCLLTATPPCMATESKSGYNNSELVLSKDCLNVDEYPTFDLGFE